MFKTDGIAAATMTGTAGLAAGTWIATATDVVQLAAAVVALMVGVASGLYYLERYRKLRNERKRRNLPR